MLLKSDPVILCRTKILLLEKFQDIHDAQLRFNINNSFNIKDHKIIFVVVDYLLQGKLFRFLLYYDYKSMVFETQ